MNRLSTLLDLLLAAVEAAGDRAKAFRDSYSDERRTQVTDRRDEWERAKRD